VESKLVREWMEEFKLDYAMFGDHLDDYISFKHLVYFCILEILPNFGVSRNDGEYSYEDALNMACVELFLHPTHNGCVQVIREAMLRLQGEK
jgi:hypothetical protein